MSVVAATRTISLLAVAFALADCGGSSNSSYVPVSSNYTVGGTISGLTSGSVVLANGSATVTVVSGSSSWVFPVSFVAGSGYSVTVQTQPTQELCAVTGGGSGMNTGNVANVTVACSFGEWAWKSGSDTVNASGIYGTLGAAAANNTPGARYSTSSWTDPSGNFWLFGGVGYDFAGSAGYLNDLWEYSSTTGWTWVNGGNGDNASGVYGTQGTAAAGNVPGARQEASSWTDSSGNLWLFGGNGYGSTGVLGNLNDLWRYTPGSGWTWIIGSNADNATGVYGTQGTAAAGNVPGARYSATSWTDSSGNLWLFGGYGYDSSGNVGKLNDLWKFTPSSGQWTWVNGAEVANATGVYGTQGTAAAANVPGARYSASPWIDSSGNLWLFGGYGYDSTGSLGRLNDLWKYTPSAGQWTWINGEDDANATGLYGIQGLASTGNVPGARYSASSWIDSHGNMWLFGGVGYDSNGAVGNLDDLWEYSQSTADWTWVGGANANRVNGSGIYGTAGADAPGNEPGGRNSVGSWVDASGNLWLFGGNGYDSTGALGYLNDLWEYTPPAGS